MDPNRTLLDAFSARARRLGVPVSAVEGSWPEAAGICKPADVVVCHHVFYNVPDLAGFASALGPHAVNREVVELTAVHPLAWMAPSWKALHGLEKPDRPTAEDAIGVLHQLGLEVRQESWQRRYQIIGEHSARGLDSIARRLCLPASRRQELFRLLEEIPPPTAGKW